MKSEITFDLLGSGPNSQPIGSSLREGLKKIASKTGIVPQPHKKYFNTGFKGEPVLIGLHFKGISSLFELGIESEDFPLLQQLSIERCNLTTTPNWLFLFKKLTHLDLSCNYLTKLDQKLNELTELEYLNLYGNPIRSMEGWDAHSITIFLNCIIQDDSLLWGWYENHDFSPDAFPLMQECVNSRIKIEPDAIIALAEYYHTPVYEIAEHIIENKSVSRRDITRLLHEITPSIRELLESNLPTDHPILKAILASKQISKNDMKILF